jgi:tetratricopeptide (TPR) repeat protein
VGADSSAADPMQEAKKHFSYAVQNKNNGNHEEALRQYSRSLSFCDTLYQVHYSYADMLEKLDRADDALVHFRKAFDLNPEHYNSAIMLSKLYHAKGLHDSVLVMYERMNTLKPGNNELLVNIAGLREYLGDEAGALDAYRKAVESGVADNGVLMRAAKLAYRTGDTAAAEYAVKILDAEPGDMEALAIAAQTALDRGDDASAAGYLKRSVEIAPDIATVVRLEALSKSLDDTDGLLWALELHHALAPEDIVVIGDLSEILYGCGEMDKAIGYVRKGLAIAPDDGRLRIILGEHFRADSQEQKALEQYRLAMNDTRWKSSAQRLIWQIEEPETADEKAEREFFSRGKSN